MSPSSPSSSSSSDTDVPDDTHVQFGRGSKAGSAYDNSALFALVQKGSKESKELVACVTNKIEQLKLNATNRLQQVSTQIADVSTS